MNPTRTLIRRGHRHFGFAVWVDGLPDLWTPADFPYTTTDTGYAAHRAILALRTLAPTSGSGDPFAAIASPCSVTLDLHDATGYISGLVATGSQTKLAAPVTDSDVAIDVEDASVLPASGDAWLVSERITYTGKTGNTLTGVTRNVGSDEPARAYPALADGTLPVYRVGTTPQYLEGLTVHVYAYGLDSHGQSINAWSDCQEVWRGIITAVPYSLTGVIWQVQAQGMERRLASAPMVGSAEATLPQAPTFVEGGPTTTLITPAARILKVKWRNLDTNETRIVSTGLPVGQLSRDQYLAAWGDIATQTLASYAAVLMAGETVGAGGSVTIIGATELGWYEAVQGAGVVWPQLGYQATGVVGVTYGTTAIVMPTDSPPKWCYFPSASPTIPVVSRQPLDWPTNGYARIGKIEVVHYQGITDTDVKIGDLRLYTLDDCERGLNGVFRDWSVPYQADSQQTDAVSVESATPLIGQSAGLALLDMLISAKIPSNWYASPTIGSVVDGTVTGARNEVLESSDTMLRAGADILALEGMMLCPGMDSDGTYRLLWRKAANPMPNPRAIAIDWDRQVDVMSGLGQVTNRLQIELYGGKVTANDLPGIAVAKAVQSKTLDARLTASLEALERCGVAGYALLHRWGRPHLAVRCALGPQYRDLAPGDPVSMALPDGVIRYWWVGQVTPSWIGGDAHCVVQLHEALDYDTVWYSPSAIVDSVGATTVVLVDDRWSSDMYESPIFAGQGARDWDWWVARGNEDVRFYDVEIGTYHDTTMTAYDAATGTMTVAAVGAVVAGWRVTWRSYSTVTAAQTGRYHFVHASGAIYHEWGA